MALFATKKTTMPTEDEALRGREAPMPVPRTHAVNRAPIVGPFPAGLETAVFGLGCFWGAERKFWQTPGVVSTNAMHSLSPVMHNAAFEEAGIDAVYVPLRACDFDDFLSYAAAMNVEGASITIPFKLDALR